MSASPVQRDRRPKAAIGTTASSAPANVIAGISRISANRSRKPPRRIPLPRPSRFSRTQKPRCKLRSLTPTPNCPHGVPAELANRNAEIAPPSSADAVRSEDHHSEATPGMSSQRSLVASRWPDSYSTAPSVNPLPSRPDPGSNENPVSRNQPTPVLTAGQLAVADMSSESPPYSAQMPLAALMGVLALAGIMGTVIFKFGSSLKLQPSQIGKRRAPIWESTDDDRIMLSRHPAAADFAHGIERPANRSERIAEFFTHISGRTPA